jgi:type I restriction-modification system DNA methylase subunit
MTGICVKGIQKGRITHRIQGRQTAKSSPQVEGGVVHAFEVSPIGKANLAGVQHFIHYLAPQGMADFVLAIGSISSNQSGECTARSASSKPKAKLQSQPGQRDIRRALIEADLVDCMVVLPGQLLYSTQIPVCHWFLATNKAAAAKRRSRGRRKQTLFIDVRKFGTRARAAKKCRLPHINPTTNECANLQ